LRGADLEPEVGAEVVRSRQGHLTWACWYSSASPSSRGVLWLLAPDQLKQLRRLAEAEIAQPGRWGTTFTVIQTWARVQPRS
jgi:hypothetical protein